MENLEEAVVVPLVPLASEPSTDGLLRMIIDREALVIQRAEPMGRAPSSGLVAPATGAFARALGEAIKHFSTRASSETTFRAVMPTGAIARDLVPAVGGGFRGLVRAPGSTKIVGQARLIPVSPSSVAKVAAGPLIATVGLAMVAEMVGQHQMDLKLDAIRRAVTSLQQRFRAEDRSVLTTARQQTRKVAGYLLDQASIPAISSAPHAFGDLDNLVNRYIEKLDEWSGVVRKHAARDRVYAPELLSTLVGKEDDATARFERDVLEMYEALALRSRVVVLEKISAELANPDRSLPHVEKVVRSELVALAERQAQLVGLLDDLSVMPIDSSRVPVAFAGKGTLQARTSFSRLARALHTTPDSLPVLNESEQAVLELAPQSGGLGIVAPSAG